MSDDPLKALSDIATEAHAKVQQAHPHINPVVGVRRGMRETGIPADAMTVDCLTTRRRIVLVLHDHHPGQLIFQFTTIDDAEGEDDPGFKQVALAQVDATTLHDWMVAYFSETA
ncbi:MAG: hypothetical protein P1U64_00560 [Alcanivoracaceae bacterium]|nr:hypothetical protein [Alcanivoracaceae bacterium]